LEGVRRKIIPYDPHLKMLARDLRNNSTTSEIKLWKMLKAHKLCGYDFHRQKPIGKYIVDFYCSELMLAVEIDGLSHRGREEYDARRQSELEKSGVSFLRFDDDEVFYNIEKVLNEIENWIKEKTKLKNDFL
jgi:very-short-patch-repair endonuclease